MRLVTRRVSFVLALALLATVAGCDRGGAGGPDKETKRFEGEITQEAYSTRSGSSGPVTIAIKGSSLRMDGVISGDAVTMVVDGSKTSWVMDPAKKHAIGLSMTDLISIAIGVGLADVSGLDIKRTGKKDVVAGIPCEEWVLTKPNVRSTSCRAESITWFDDPSLAEGYLQKQTPASQHPEDLRAFFRQFPLRSVSVDGQGVETSRQTTTKVERRNLDDARFVVPADYDKMNLAPLMEGLGILFKNRDAGRTRRTSE
jgi:hypothetical protein